MENVTLRNRPMQRNSEDDCFNSLDSITSVGALSLPDLSTADFSEQRKVMEQTIQELQLQLHSAHREIETLMEDGNALRKTNLKQLNQIEALKKICSDTSSTKTVPSTLRKRKINPRRLTLRSNPGTPNHNIDESMPFIERQKEDDTENSATNNSQLDRETHKTTRGEIVLIEKATTTKDKCTETDHNVYYGPVKHDEPTRRECNCPTIHIFGGKQCVNLAAELIDTRHENMKTKYNIKSITKSHAPCENILMNVNRDNISDKDIVILSVGEHDHNPTKLSVELSATLKNLKNVTVIVVGITSSDHLNEKKLNGTIKIICNVFENCHFISIDEVLPKKKYTQRLCAEVNKIQAKLEQDIDLCKSKLNNNVNIDNGKKESIKKGTIPYYFNKSGTIVFKGNSSKHMTTQKNNEVSPSAQKKFFLVK